MKHPSEGQPRVSSTLHSPPSPSSPLWGRVTRALEVGVRHTHLAPMIKSPDPVTMSVSLYSAHTPSNCSGLVECEPSPPASVVGDREGDTTRHPPLMDGGHYGSWGQVPLTIKGPSQWLGKNGSGNRREDGKGNCCGRTSKHKRCREKQTGNEWRGGGEGGGVAGRRDRWREQFSLYNMTACAPKQRSHKEPGC